MLTNYIKKIIWSLLGKGVRPARVRSDRRSKSKGPAAAW